MTTANHQHDTSNNNDAEIDMKATSSIVIQAPSDMPGGYEFFADTGNGTSYKLRVPDEGVKAGERFNAIIVEETAPGSSSGNSNGHSIPTGRWRDGLCDCCTMGIFDTVLCLGLWCRMCLLGQVLTRNKLNWFGNYNGPQINVSTYQFWFAMMVVSLVLGAAGSGVNARTGFATLLSLITTVIGILACLTTCRAREYLRSKYNIAEENCTGCEDCCCATWCSPCTICQMARHTADYQRHKAEYCTSTGLGPDAPEIV